MPAIDKPALFCREGMSDLWDATAAYLDFIEEFGVDDVTDCAEPVFPDNNAVEDAGCLIMCQVYNFSPIARCIIPITPTSWIETDCSE